MTELNSGADYFKDVNYCKLYHILSNAIADALEELGHLNIPAATRLLEDAQIEAEDCIMELPPKDEIRERIQKIYKKIR